MENQIKLTSIFWKSSASNNVICSATSCDFTCSISDGLKNISLDIYFESQQSHVNSNSDNYHS